MIMSLRWIGHQKNAWEKMINQEEIKQRIVPVWLKLALWSTVIAIVIMGIFISAKALPWKPYTVYSVYTDIDEACVFDRINLTQDSAVEDGWYTIGNLVGSTYWVDSAGYPYPGATFDVDIEPFERTDIPTNTVRLAPPEPGYWYAGGEATLYGYRLGFIPVEQLVVVKTETPILVKEWDDPSCLKERVPNVATKR